MKTIEKVYISKEVIQKITYDIANQRPEAGGLLMGPPDKDAITFFEYDKFGQSGSLAYTPEAERLSQIAAQKNRECGWIIKGIVHSHPGNMDSLSYGDIQAIRDHFQINPGTPYFVALLVYRTLGVKKKKTFLKINIDKPDNTFLLDGRQCNAMVAYATYVDEKHNLNLENITITEFSSLYEVPPSSFPFTQKEHKSERKLKPREQNDMQAIESAVPHAEAKDVKGTIIWYEWRRDKEQRYQLAYWYENKRDGYQAAVIEGLCSKPTPKICLEEDGRIIFNRKFSDILKIRKAAMDWIPCYSEFLKTGKFRPPQ
ncbi:MAG: hypothetical protein Q3M24_19915 [Candidatus Electrothrix aestuarii]|uniref:JAB domain-containing protein n=1 Tax=Candidatus Electrothrix aestuarii TaxID=3062594 RepID=A0AAU8LTB2_9BACT|nr:hypothetical protein [Candidatus Electrothrix aestuarii]